MLTRKVVVGAIATLTLVLGASAAMAAPGRATSTVNVRSGPGTFYKVIDQLKAGERVDIQKCIVDWCYVGKPGVDGWVADSFLQHTAAPIVIAPPVVVRPPIVIRPPHLRPPHHRPKPPHHRPPHKPGKPRPPICSGKPQIQICRPR